MQPARNQTAPNEHNLNHAFTDTRGTRPLQVRVTKVPHNASTLDSRGGSRLPLRNARLNIKQVHNTLQVQQQCVWLARRARKTRRSTHTRTCNTNFMSEPATFTTPLHRNTSTLSSSHSSEPIHNFSWRRERHTPTGRERELTRIHADWGSHTLAHTNTSKHTDSPWRGRGGGARTQLHW